MGVMISKEERERDRAILEAAVKGPSYAWEADQHAVNRLPAYIREAEEMERRIADIEFVAREMERLAVSGEANSAEARASATTLRTVLRILRGEP